MTLAGETTVGYANNHSGSTTCGAGFGVDKVYTVQVPAGNRVTVTVTPATGYDPAVVVTEGLTDGQRVQIVAGLAPGDLVVADARRQFADGARVRATVN